MFQNPAPYIYDSENHCFGGGAMVCRIVPKNIQFSFLGRAEASHFNYATLSGAVGVGTFLPEAQHGLNLRRRRKVRIENNPDYVPTHNYNLRHYHKTSNEPGSKLV